MSSKCSCIFQVQICYKIFDLHTFSAFCGPILHFLVFFEIQFLNVDVVKFTYIFFFPYVFHSISEEPLPNLRSQVVMPMFSSESLIGLTFIFKYLMRFELIFVYDVKCKGSYPKFICVWISNLLVGLLKRSFFTLEKIWAPLIKINTINMNV